MKKVLIITYYWPPSGGAGVQRWLKFVKYLREYGWEPIIYTAQDAEYPMLDETLVKDIPNDVVVIKQPIWEPYQLYKKLIGQKKETRVVSGFLNEKGEKGFTQKLSLWIRGNIFIPDARKFWISPSIKYLNAWLKENEVDAIVSTGPPHSMHLIAKGLKKKTKLPWLADFRDPWVNIDFAADLSMSKYASKKNIKLEGGVLRNADQVVVVSDFMAEEFKSKTSKPVDVITNGYDPDDFIVDESRLNNHESFTLVHTGSLNDRRNHPVLWKVIAELREQNAAFKKDFVLRLIGKNDASVRRSIQENRLEECTEFVDYLSHEEIIIEQKSASVLLLSINNYGESEKEFFSPKATLTGKLFEYLAAQRPILMIGPTDGQAATVLKQNSVHQISDFSDREAMSTSLIKLYETRMNSSKIEAPLKYSRKELTKSMCALLDKIKKASQ